MIAIILGKCCIGISPPPMGFLSDGWVSVFVCVHIKNRSTLEGKGRKYKMTAKYEPFYN